MTVSLRNQFLCFRGCAEDGEERVVGDGAHSFMLVGPSWLRGRVSTQSFCWCARTGARASTRARFCPLLQPAAA